MSDFWFPVAPGISTLPPAPEVINGQMTVVTVIPIWNQTTIVEGSVRPGVEVQSLPYALEIETTIPDQQILLEFLASSKISKSIQIPAILIAQNVHAPTIAAGKNIVTPAAPIAIVANQPLVSSTTTVEIPKSELIVSPLTPSAIGRGTLVVDIPTSKITAAQSIPAINTGINLQLSSVDISVSSRIPIVSTGSKIIVSSTQINLQGLAPQNAGPLIDIFVAAINFSVVIQTPIIAIGASVACPVVAIGIHSKDPEIVGTLAQEQEPGLTLLLEDDLLSLFDF
jgi:hypothetical protein